MSPILMTNEIEIDVKKLITSLSGFKERSENFHSCLQFILSNFRFHRYLDVDSHKVKQQVKGVCHKLIVHSKGKKAEALQCLFETFLNSPISQATQHPQTDIHYGLISLLICLANTPTEHDYKEIEKPVQLEKEPEFDWTSYLLEGLEVDGPHLYPDSPEEWSEDDEDDTSVAGDTSLMKVTTFNATDGGQSNADAPTVVTSSRNWLEMNVVVQYWDGKVDETVASHYPTANLANMWDAYASDVSPIHVTNTKCTITETQLIRESLWILMGSPCSYVYEIIDDTLTPRSDIQVSHLTPVCLYNCLQLFANYGNMVLKIKIFIDNVTQSGCSNVEHKPSQTYQAYACAIKDVLLRLQADLSRIERDVIRQESTITLTQLSYRLHPAFVEIDSVFAVFRRGILTCPEDISDDQRTCWLLEVLYESLLEEDAIGGEGNQVLSNMLPIWLKSIKPYLDIIDTWISHGILPMHSQEFLIRRNEEVEISSEAFWSEGFILSSKRITDSQDKESSHRGVPEFLEPIINHVLVAGKSMQLMEALGKLSGSMKSSQLSIYCDFMKSLQQMFGDRSIITSDHHQGMMSEDVQSEPCTTADGDPFLHQNFMELFSSDWFTTEKLKSKNDLEMSKVNLQPIQLMLHRCLYPFIEKKCQSACIALIQLLKKDYKILDFLTSLRKFYLLEAGDTMYDFYTNCFDKLRRNEHWQDVTYLNLQLHEALQAKYQTETDRLTAGFENRKLSSKKSTQLVHALDGLAIHYKVPWPVNVIINQSCLKIYNQIHTFLVQVKRAKYGLDQLKEADLTPRDMLSSNDGRGVGLFLPHADKTNLIHKMFIMRMKLLHFVNSLHVYLMTRILHGTGLEYQDRLETASDMDEVIRVHQEYMTAIFQRCLLDKKAGFVKEAIMKVLNLAVVFQCTWDANITNLSVERFSKMADELNKCNNFLVTLLSSIVKRGAFPHLEGLALALTFGNEKASENT